MRHRLAFVAAAAASLGLVLAGCSGEADNGAQDKQHHASAPAPKEKQQNEPAQQKSKQGGKVDQAGVQWIDGFCGGLTNFAKSFQGVQPPNPQDPNAVKTSMSQMLDNLTQGSATFVAHVDKLGPSPLKGGNEVVSTVKQAYQEMSTSADRAKSKLDSAPSSNPQATAQAVQAAGKDIGAVMKRMQNTGKNMTKSPELSQAANQAPQCKAIGQMAQQQQQQGQAPMPGN